MSAWNYRVIRFPQAAPDERYQLCLVEYESLGDDGRGGKVSSFEVCFTAASRADIMVELSRMVTGCNDNIGQMVEGELQNVGRRDVLSDDLVRIECLGRMMAREEIVVIQRLLVGGMWELSGFIDAMPSPPPELVGWRKKVEEFLDTVVFTGEEGVEAAQSVMPGKLVTWKGKPATGVGRVLYVDMDGTAFVKFASYQDLINVADLDLVRVARGPDVIQ